MKALSDFIIESNKIERESTNLILELLIYEWWLSVECNEENLKEFHKRLCDARGQLEKKYRGIYRDIPIYIGDRKYSHIGLDGKMYDFWNDLGKKEFDGDIVAYIDHKSFEKIHPFADLNGRTGRAIWLHQIGGKAPIGFLHQWYYQSLSST